jgi:hypothetical protein
VHSERLIIIVFYFCLSINCVTLKTQVFIDIIFSINYKTIINFIVIIQILNIIYAKSKVIIDSEFNIKVLNLKYVKSKIISNSK